MSTQPRSDLQSTTLTLVPRNAQDPLGTKDFTALATTWSPVAPSAREALITTAPYRPSEFREDLAVYVAAGPLGTDVIDAGLAPEHLNAPASGLKTEDLSSRRAPRGKPDVSEGCEDDLPGVEGLTVALCRARDRSETASRALLARAYRDLREPLTAMLRLHSDWNVRGTDRVAQRMIEQQRRVLDVIADFIDGCLTIAELETARPSALRAAEWSAEWSMSSAADRPEVPVSVGRASRERGVLLIDEDRGVLGALRLHLLCAGYRVFAVASAAEALNRARMARIGASFIDIIIVDLDLSGDDDGLAVIDKTRLLLGERVPAVLLATQASIEIGQPALVADISLLRKPVNVDELNALIGEVLKRRTCSRLAPLRTTGANLGHDEPSPEVVR